MNKMLIMAFVSSINYKHIAQMSLLQLMPYLIDLEEMHKYMLLFYMIITKLLI